MRNEDGGDDVNARRRFLKQAGAVAWGAPLIVTMMGRAAHAQALECGVVGVTFDGEGNATFHCNVVTPCGSTDQCAPVRNPDGSLSTGNPCACQAA